MRITAILMLTLLSSSGLGADFEDAARASRSATTAVKPAEDGSSRDKLEAPGAESGEVAAETEPADAVAGEEPVAAPTAGPDGESNDAVADAGPADAGSPQSADTGPEDAAPPQSADTGKAAAAEQAADVDLDGFCKRVDVKLTSVDQLECVQVGLLDSGARSNNATPLLYKDFVPDDGEPSARVLLIGGIHGDEYSSVSVVFKWLDMLGHEDLGEKFHWRVIPVLNPDGLLRPPRMSSRMNANGVDLNRNFPTPDWDPEAHEYWIKRTRRNERRYPGPSALSEPESAWLAQQIETFKPHAVISVHAPHGVVDFDGPRVPPRQLGPLELRLLGTYPGSMGRYIGVHKGIPLLTVELESAFGMPQRDQIYDIWYDMLGWLHEKIARPMQLAEQQRALEAPTELLRIEAGPDNGG